MRARWRISTLTDGWRWGHPKGWWNELIAFLRDAEPIGPETFTADRMHLVAVRRAAVGRAVVGVDAVGRCCTRGGSAVRASGDQSELECASLKLGRRYVGSLARWPNPLVQGGVGVPRVPFPLGASAFHNVRRNGGGEFPQPRSLPARPGQVTRSPSAATAYVQPAGSNRPRPRGLSMEAPITPPTAGRVFDTGLGGISVLRTCAATAVRGLHLLRRTAPNVLRHQVARGDSGRSSVWWAPCRRRRQDGR